MKQLSKRSGFINLVLIAVVFIHWVETKRRITFWELVAFLSLFLANFIFGELALIRRGLEEGAKD